MCIEVEVGLLEIDRLSRGGELMLMVSYGELFRIIGLICYGVGQGSRIRVIIIGKKKRLQQINAEGVLNKNPASSYSPTQLPVQYHRR
jgi:hypothetical protein